MEVSPWVWVGWLAAFVAIEAAALLNDKDGDTLSENVWRWFPKHKMARWGVLALFMGWLSIHFLQGD